MLISDLLRYRDDVQKTLDQFDLTKVMSEIKNQFTRLNVSYPQFPGEVKLTSAETKFDNLAVESVKIKEHLTTILADINITIDKLSESLPDLNSFHRQDFHTADSVASTVTANIHHNSDFHFPALQLGCTAHSKRFTGELVANDPLYLYDADQLLVEDIAGQFNEIYYQRLRRYTDLEVLPYNQFGFIFSWMLFNYKKYAEIQEYLKKLILFLRPGGRFLFSYNNCDLVESCTLAEDYSMSYVSKRHLLEFCRSLGYEIVYEYDLPNDDYHVKWISWIEIKKPGVLNTVKRKQVMGAIHQK
jgi:hypothetical protein